MVFKRKKTTSLTRTLRRQAKLNQRLKDARERAEEKAKFAKVRRATLTRARINAKAAVIKARADRRVALIRGQAPKVRRLAKKTKKLGKRAKIGRVVRPRRTSAPSNDLFGGFDF